MKTMILVGFLLVLLTAVQASPIESDQDLYFGKQSSINLAKNNNYISQTLMTTMAMQIHLCLMKMVGGYASNNA